tara:strand:- start:817 stop:1722 length:906 start_codon:yes stop_codon:yes gene_type:complete
MKECKRLCYNLPDELLNKITKYSLPIYRKPSHGIIMTRQYNIIKLQIIKKIDNIVKHYSIKEKIKQNNNNKVIGNNPLYDIAFLDNFELGELFNNPLNNTKYSEINMSYFNEENLKILLKDVKHYMLKKNKYKKTSLKKLFLQNKKLYIKKNNIKTISSIITISKKNYKKIKKQKLKRRAIEDDSTLGWIHYIEYKINEISELLNDPANLVTNNTEENNLFYLIKCHERLRNDNFNKFGLDHVSTQKAGCYKFLMLRLLDSKHILYAKKKYLMNKKLYKKKVFSSKNKYNYQKRNSFIRVR